jgi:hypothetical protein
MRLSLLSSLSTLTLVAAVAACDPGPAPVVTSLVPAQPAAPPAQVDDRDHLPAGALAAAEPAAEAPEDALRAQLLGLNKKPVADAVADQVEPQKAQTERRRGARRPAPPQDELRPEPQGAMGGLSDGEFQAAVNGWRGIQSCLVENAGHMESRNGAMQVSFQIAGDGSVAECKVVGTTTEVAQLIAPCVEKKARRIRFPAYPGSETTKVAKFVF